MFSIATKSDICDIRGDGSSDPFRHVWLPADSPVTRRARPARCVYWLCEISIGLDDLCWQLISGLQPLVSGQETFGFHLLPPWGQCCRNSSRLNGLPRLSDSSFMASFKDHKNTYRLRKISLSLIIILHNVCSIEILGTEVAWHFLPFQENHNQLFQKEGQALKVSITLMGEPGRNTNWLRDGGFLLNGVPKTVILGSQLTLNRWPIVAAKQTAQLWG